MTSTIFLLCGLPGSGKTTLARDMEAQRGVLRLNEDEWVVRLFPAEDAHDDAKRDAIKDVQWTLAVRIVRAGLDVVLDWGVWARGERDHYRARAAADNVRLHLIYLDVSREELTRRLTQRNAALPPDTFEITDAMLDAYWRLFDPPTEDELVAPSKGLAPSDGHPGAPGAPEQR